MYQKYKIANVKIPANKRKEINKKILYIINNNVKSAITPEDIFNAYTGDGGLHGLDRKEYDSYYKYSEAKKEIEMGQFFTPHNICRFIANCIRSQDTDLVGDLTCGMGNFFNYVPVEANIYGCELDVKAYKVAKYLYPKANIANEDIRFWKPDVKLDIIFGNPPFNLRWNVKDGEYLSQYYYILKAAEILKPGGFLATIVPEAFLSDEFTDGNMIKRINELFNFIMQFSLPPTSFKSVGVDIFKTKVMFFQKRSEHLPAVPYDTAKIEINGITDGESQRIYETFLKPLQEQKEKIRSKLFLEAIQVDVDSKENAEFQFRVRKLLYDIKSHPKLKDYYAKAQEYVNKYYTQKKPESMTFEEWEQKKLTKNKVLAYLKNILKKQSKKPEIDRIRLVKTAYGLKLKGDSHKARIRLSKMLGRKEISFNEMILNEEYPFEDKTYLRLYKKKLREYKRQSPEFKNMTQDINITKHLKEFTLYNKRTGEIIQLNDIQKHDLNLILQKRYGILNWQQGSGKTIGALAWSKFLYDTTSIRNVFVVSAAISIYGTWVDALKNFSISHILIQSLSDIEKIKPRQIVLITSDMLIKYQRYIKKFVKKNSHKIALVFDESDELTNHRSKRTQASLNCFRRVKYKLLTTGTTTRNNISELYSQLELLYNNSINMLCECEYIYEYNKDNELEKKYNSYYMEPFPAYYGNKLFKKCFNPSRTTVFGVRKHNQDIYNIKALEKLVAKTIITRKFREIAGKDIYDINQVTVKQNPYEKEVYRVIIEEFSKIMLHYFSNTGNNRKESILKIIRQIKLLIKASSTPHLFKEYADKTVLPEKYLKIINMLKNMNEKVAIGTVFVDTATDYYQKLKGHFPNRPIFLVKGSISLNARKKIIREFEATSNGILISTQQSLSCSINIPTCNKVIVESMQWNIPRIEQYYFRFIRYNSTEHKDVYFVTYENTIEQNLLALLMAKERLNDYIKTLDYRDTEELFEEFGIDISILDQIIEKEKDEKGNIKLTWGHQKVS